ncbi:SH3 beta-barrel fold-containing protein [Bacteroides sp. 51]|uniref:SH3 beta-barrel fold-containing protein n=1 Tax=Bacteroides sp. 51 TaxID=2302938 RepID=UPI0013D24F02|nr:SH3 beta-barrel fold-containing protein [Bacteroides sp. 51]NDV83358.1 hypothetical protein [Bacteroides sp. 51]
MMKEVEKDEDFGRNVMQRAILMQRITGRALCMWMDTAALVEELEKKMLVDVVRFTFMGQDNNERSVNGTLRSYQQAFGKPYSANRNSRFLAYYDVDVKEWRTFQITGLIKIVNQ